MWLKLFLGFVTFSTRKIYFGSFGLTLFKPKLQNQWYEKLLDPVKNQMLLNKKTRGNWFKQCNGRSRLRDEHIPIEWKVQSTHRTEKI